MASSTRLWILALVLTACGEDSDSAALAVQEISVPDFGVWPCNRPIEFVFNQRLDFASVSGQSIRMRTSIGVPAAGTFAPRGVDSNGDGEAERSDTTVVVFYPSCPLAEDLSDAGLTPGERYVVTLVGADSGLDPATFLRGRSGAPLARTVVHAFETIADPASTLHDERAGAPVPLLRQPGATAGAGCYLELGRDPSRRVHFELGPVSGRLQGGLAAPLNLFGDPAARVAFVVVFDQLIRALPENLARLSLEYRQTLASPWLPIETHLELVSNCGPDGAAVRLTPLGTFPPGGHVRARIAAGFQDLVGEATTAVAEEFAIAEVRGPSYASLAPSGAIADEIREEFDFGPESPLSLADPRPPLDAVQALWGQGELRANPEIFVLPDELREFDVVVRERETLLFDTNRDTVEGGPSGARTIVQHTSGGLLLVRNLLVERGGTLRVFGPNPMVLHAKGTVTIRGTIDASGFDAPDLPTLGTGPGLGGPGAAGGGAGGSGSTGAAARGASGLAAFAAGLGAQGGESGLSPADQGAEPRGGGGGGGRFARDQGAFVAERGFTGILDSSGAESGFPPPQGGAPGPDVFVDGDPTNDFFGIQPIVDASGVVIGKRRGELASVHAGTGGGNGGDSIDSETFPPAPGLAREGGGGGGGGGGLVIRAVGRIVFGARGKVLANGGQGARRGGGTQTRDGACGGSGSGGHVILESADAIDFTAGNPGVVLQSWVEALGGARVQQPPSQRGAGGAGGPGVVQLHVPNPERPLGHPDSNLILPIAALTAPDPLASVCQPRPVVLYPSIGARSRALSRWIPLGAAGEEAAARPESAVGVLFGGIETTPGEREGLVLTRDERVRELAPLLGPARLAQPGIQLLADGASLSLTGAVLAPLRASAEPISPDVYLRTPALLAGSTLRLANAADPARRNDLAIAAARYDDAAARLTLTAGGLGGTLADAVAELGGTNEVELALVPRFFRVRLAPGGADFLPDTHSVRILFQGAADDGSGRPDEENPLVDWTADVSAFGALQPGALDFVRFQVEFELDTGNVDPSSEPLALEFLRLPMRF